MVINTNIAAINAARLLEQSTDSLNSSLARLSSGSKIVNASDDPAGTAVSMRFTAQINRTEAAESNVSSATSYNQTQDGFLQNVSDALNRMSELAMLAQDSTKSDTDRSLYNKEFTTLGQYIDNISTKDFNGVSLFNGNTLAVTIDSEGNTFGMTGVNLSSNTYTAATDAAVDTLSHAQSALTAVEGAINQLAADRATVGANSSRLSFTSDQLSVLDQNLQAANSNISDVDVAQESTNYAKYSILVQSGTAMLAQANSLPSEALKLLGS
jgi:flagellin